MRAGLWRKLAPNIRETITGNTGAVAGTVILTNLMRIVSSVVLTRLLSSEAYGVVGVVTSVAVVFGLVSDIGTTAFVIRHDRGKDRDFLDEVWTIRLIRSIALTVAMSLLAGPVSNWLGKPELHYPLMIGSLTFVFEGLSSLAFVTALRDHMVKRLSLIDIGMSVLGFVIALVCAVVFRNFWAILISNAANQALRAILSFWLFANSSRRWRLSLERMRELWSFARFITGSTIITLILGQTDKLVLSRAFTLSVFGFYSLASNLATAPLGLSGSYAARILYPVYAERWRESPQALERTYYQQRILVSLLYAIGVGILIGAAPLIIHILYDERYRPAIPFLQLLSVSSLFALNNQSMNEVMIARGRSVFTLNANIVRLVWLVTTGFAGYRYYGAIGLVAALGLIEVPAQIYGWIEVHRAGLLRWKYEIAILVASAAGIGAGRAVNSIGLWLMS